MTDTLEKSTTKEYWACRHCGKKMETLKINTGTDSLFGLSGSTSSALYCDNKECAHYGNLTVVGIRKTE